MSSIERSISLPNLFLCFLALLRISTSHALPFGHDCHCVPYWAHAPQDPMPCLSAAFVTVHHNGHFTLRITCPASLPSYIFWGVAIPVLLGTWGCSSSNGKCFLCFKSVMTLPILRSVMTLPTCGLLPFRNLEALNHWFRITA